MIWNTNDVEFATRSIQVDGKVIKASAMALFPSSRPPVLNPFPNALLEFRAGRLNLHGTMNVCIVPNEVELKKIPQCTTGRVFLLRFTRSGRRLFFWMQEPDQSKDEELFKKIGDYLTGQLVYVMKLFFGAGAGISVKDGNRFLDTVGLIGKMDDFRPVFSVEYFEDESRRVVEIAVSLCADRPGQLCGSHKAEVRKCVMKRVGEIGQTVDFEFKLRLTRAHEFRETAQYTSEAKRYIYSSKRELNPDGSSQRSAEDIATCDVYAFNDTTSRLYKSILKYHKSENLVVCPLAIFNNLHLAYVLSKGQTKDEIQNAFFGFDQQLEAKPDIITHLKREGLQASLNQIRLLTEMGAPGTSAKNAAFDLFTEEMLVVSSQLELNTKNGVLQVDWSEKDAARDKINRELQGKTEKRIAQLVKSEHIPGKSNSGVLVSAARFTANWEDKFLTKSRSAYPTPNRDFLDGLPMSMEDFHNSDGSVKKVLMVHLEEKIMLTRDEDLKVTLLELPLKKYAMNMIIVLPDDKSAAGLRSFEESIKHRTFEILLKNARMPLTRVYLPKFNLETEVSLNKSLTDMGVKHLFDAGGLFSNNPDWADLTTGGDALTHVTEVLHGASFSVSGECDTAKVSAKTGSKKPKRDNDSDANGGASPQCVQLESARFANGMHINRPFFFMVQSRWPTYWSFMGHVQHLEQADSAVWHHLNLPQ